MAPEARTRSRRRNVEPSRPTPPSVMEELLGDAEAHPPADVPEPADAGAAAEPDADGTPDGTPDETPAPGRQAARKARKAAAAPARRPAPPSGRRGGADGRRRPWALPLPDAYGKKSVVPVQAFVPAREHWDFKVASMLQGSDISKNLLALIGAYLRAPDLWQPLLARFAAAEGTDDDERLDGVLRDALEAALEEAEQQE